MGDYKIINDPVHGTIKLSGPLLELAGTPELNRLAHIKQLGLAYLVFPGAHHTRFEHSLGTCHVAGMLARSIGLDYEEVLLVQTAGLLHDLGHGPFSHTLESIFHNRLGLDHMELTKLIITGAPEEIEDEWRVSSDGKERYTRTIPEIIEDVGMKPGDVASLVCQEGEEVLPTQTQLGVQEDQVYFGTKSYLGQIIHSALDADQLDFLRRDSHYTGVALGIIDLNRIMQTSTLFHGEFMLHRRGTSALEGMLVARSLMYSSVYFHKTARIAEGMLCRAGDELTDDQIRSIWPMTDGEVLHLMREHGGKASELAERLRYRQLYKSAYRIHSDMLTGEGETSLDLREIIDRLCQPREKKRTEAEICRKAGIEDGSVMIDVPDPSLTLSEPRLRRTDIKVLGERPTPLSKISGLARALQRRPPIPWCLMVFCAEKNRNDVRSASKNIFGRS